jgi:hypothetical protein
MRIFAFSTLVLNVAGFLALATPVAAGSLIMAEPEAVDFGQVSQGDPVAVTFQLYNTSSNPMMITFMDFSMPGLVAQVNPRLKPESSSEVLVRWDTSSLSGDVQGEVTLEFNGPENLEIVLTVSGSVVSNEEEGGN